MLDITTFKSLAGIPISDTGQDTVLQFILDNVSEIICNYCNIAFVPKGLQNTAYRMALDILRTEHAGNGNDVGQGSISSIKEGDTEVSFGNTIFSQAYVNSILKCYEKTLVRYRKLGGFSCR